MTHPDVPAEQVHVDHAYGRLGAMRAAAATRLADAFGERGGTFQSFTERDIRVRNSLSRLDQLQIGRESLIFGRIDPQPGEGGAGDDGSEEAFHIGRLAVSDVDQEPLVVDWRAPVAEPFYRATGAHPMGLRRRRHFLTESQQVLDLEDELFDRDGDDSGVGLGLSGPQVLLAALERTRTGRMRDIVATVQREQDEIIRGDLPGILVVQGGPGTGKTAVALHRAAYLLYTHRFPLETQGVLVVGPNPTFLRYIEHVLPSLGESGVQLSTVSGLVSEVTVQATDDTETERLKGDARMGRVLAHAVRDRQRPLRRSLELPYGRTTLRLTPEASAQIVTAARRRPGTHNARRRTFETLLWRHLAEQLARRLERNGTDDGVPAEPPAPADLGRELRRLPMVIESLDRMWPVLTPAELVHDLFGALPLIELATRGQVEPTEAKRLHRARSAHPSEAPWTPADLALLDEARALLGPVRRRQNNGEDIRAFGHIVADEAQDLSPMQLRMLARRSLSGSMTVVGDIAQSTGAWAPGGWADVVRHLPTARPWRQVELTVNYRTPSEIMELAGRVLAATEPDMRPPESVRASGEVPRLVAVEATGDDPIPALAAGVLAQIAAADDAGTVAVIVPPVYMAGISEAMTVAGVTHGQVGRNALESEVTLLVLADAKGLEFDTVIVVEPAALIRDAPQGLRSLYVALTRPTRRLVIVHGEPLPAALTVGRPDG